MHRRDLLRGLGALALATSLPAPVRAEGGDVARSALLAELRSGRPCAAEAAALRGTLSRMDRVRVPKVGRTIVVDLPSQSLDAYEGPDSVLQSVVVVGDPDWRTPDLDTTVAYVRFNPTWTVPRSIVESRGWADRLRRDPAYFSRLNFRIVADGRSTSPEDASSRGIRNASFVQQPGHGNVRGEFKFGLNAGQDVYLHDTNDRDGYGEEGRALSHGCMRVERAMELAAWTLGIDAAEARHRVDADDRAEHRPSSPVRVITTYFTAWPDREGRIAYYHDVYGRDGGGARCGSIPGAARSAPSASTGKGSDGADHRVAPDYEVAE